MFLIRIIKKDQRARATAEIKIWSIKEEEDVDDDKTNERE